jgi:hypothetical protein
LDFESEGLSLVAMPRDGPLFTLLRIIAVCLHTIRLHFCMLWLTTIMQKPAIARRVIAIELLRRLDQIEGRRSTTQTNRKPQLQDADAPNDNQRFVPIKLDWRYQQLSTSQAQCPLFKTGTRIRARTSYATTSHSYGNLQGINTELAVHDEPGTTGYMG